jgi:hypothetical protein
VNDNGIRDQVQKRLEQLLHPDSWVDCCVAAHTTVCLNRCNYTPLSSLVISILTVCFALLFVSRCVSQGKKHVGRVLRLVDTRFIATNE